MPKGYSSGGIAMEGRGVLTGLAIRDACFTTHIFRSQGTVTLPQGQAREGHSPLCSHSVLLATGYPSSLHYVVASWAAGTGYLTSSHFSIQLRHESFTTMDKN